MDASTSATARMLKLAGFQRLLSQINTDEPIVDQTHIMRLAEERVYAYTKTLEPSRLRTSPKPILMQIEDIIRPFQFKHKPSFLALWDFVLTGAGEPPQIKTHLELIKSVSHNNKLKRLILPQLQTLAKYTGIVKHILNLGKEFQSLFDEVELTSTETILRASAKLEEAAMQSSLELFLTKQTFEADEEALIQQFYGCVAKLSDPTLRNTFFNRLLNQLIHTTKMTSLTPHLTNLFVLFYDRLVNHELVTTVDPLIAKWLTTNPIPFFTHSMSKLSMLLPPYTPFQKAAITLDLWQRQGLEAMRRGESIFLDVPTSGGKTLAASEAINIYDNVLYVMPEKPLVEQFTSIAVATLTDSERRGLVERNVRQEVNESTKPYRRFPSRKDNIVIGQPKRIYELLHSKALVTPFQCVVLDEFHNLQDPEHGLYYQYILFWAAMKSLPVVAMTATLRNGPEIAEQMSKIVAQPLFAVHLKKRFFNQRRMVFRLDGDKISLVTVNPLDHLRLDTLKSPHFRHPGLVPGEVLRLYNNVPSFPRIDERKAHVPTLDDVEGIEEALFEHVAKQPPEVMATLIKETPLAGDQLTPYQIVTTLRSINDEHKPLLLFKSDPLENLAFHKLLFVDLLTQENELVYGNFQDDQAILEDYFQALEDMSPDEEGGGDGEAAEKHREARRKQREALFNSKFLPKLLKFDEAYVDPKPDPKRLEEFNAKFGANLTHAYIVRKRREHVEEQYRTYDTVCLRPEYTIHRKIKISANSNGAVMKEIKNLVETELAFQRKQTGAFPLMQQYGPEFAAYDNILETRFWTKWNQEKHKFDRTGIQETHRIDQPWPSPRLDNDELDYSYEISYDHPILLGIECGILFNNALLNPAFNYICQFLISKHPLVVLSCKSYATGVNFPFKTVWVQGSFKGQPLESLPNSLVWQMMGRGGRRGLFRLATGIYSGIETSHVMFPEFKPIGFHPFESMVPLLEGEEEEFVTFVKTLKRPEPKAKAKVEVKKAIVVQAPTIVTSSPSPTTCSAETKIPETFDSWEEMAAFLEG
jgi:replicative superfamily II helicase